MLCPPLLCLSHNSDWPLSVTDHCTLSAVNRAKFVSTTAVRASSFEIMLHDFSSPSLFVCSNRLVLGEIYMNCMPGAMSFPHFRPPLPVFLVMPCTFFIDSSVSLWHQKDMSNFIITRVIELRIYLAPLYRFTRIGAGTGSGCPSISLALYVSCSTFAVQS
jgi:hypothetical protein